jgi:hypothetical protein
MAFENDGCLHPSYLDLLGDVLEQDYSVVNIVEAVYKLLGSPIHPCDNCNLKFNDAAKKHNEEVELIQQYAGIRLHPNLFEVKKGWLREWFDPRFLRLVEISRTKSREEVLDWVEEISPDVFVFPVFTPLYCNLVLGEMENYRKSGLRIRRPNSMNNYGLILNSIGLEPMLSLFQEQYLQPLTRLLLPEAGGVLDEHHSFLVKYKVGQDRGLDMHTDDSDVTFNVCLGRQFSGAELSFCGHIREADHRLHRKSYQHVQGWAVMHLGSQRHGAADIKSGERINLIMWNRSYVYRYSRDQVLPKYEAEVAPPDPVCVSFTHDRDYKQYINVPEDIHTGNNQWCPPRGLEFRE